MPELSAVWPLVEQIGFGAIAGFIAGYALKKVGKVVASDAFADAWVQANRAAHDELVKALTGQGGGAVTVENDTVSINLAPFIQTVKQRLTEAGFGLAARKGEQIGNFQGMRLGAARITGNISQYEVQE